MRQEDLRLQVPFEQGLTAFGCWRFCVATNRNLYTIGTDRKRPDQRTRQAIFGMPRQFAAGAWMHLSVSWAATWGAIHVDGQLDTRADLPEGLPDKPLPEFFQVGAVSSWINAGPCGVIADFRVYDRALTTSEIGHIVWAPAGSR